MGDPCATAPLDLSRGGLRLIALQPHEDSETIKCDMQSYITMDYSHLSYTALSYAWGPDQIYGDIELNGAKMPIRRNLWLFLRKMQQRRRYYEPLWIDAICINQSMVQEVNHQVSRMERYMVAPVKSLSGLARQTTPATLQCKN
jgi:hypothetical protein